MFVVYRRNKPEGMHRMPTQIFLRFLSLLIFVLLAPTILFRALTCKSPLWQSF